MIGLADPYVASEISVDHKSSNSQAIVQTNQANSNQELELQGIGSDSREPHEPSSGNEEIILESMEKNPYDVSYTCLLLPKIDSHFLLDDVASQLHVWMKQICSSYGWRLEFLSITPDYLHWTIRVPPATSTSYFIRIIREQTSMHVFTDFPRIKSENDSDDFWAPGYLIIWGSQPHPIEIIKRFIRQTRLQQGIRLDE
jgi:REP element-mobilizing transposase RayT